MSRYIERASHVCSLLANQLEAIHDRPTDDIERGWRRIFAALDREPAGAGLMSNAGDDAFMLFDAYTLTDDLTFEESNPNAILHCFARARENARQIRNVISRDMWSSLNVSYLSMHDKRLQDIWDARPRDFFVNATVSVETFRGIAEATMYRDPGWHFFRLGRFVERTGLTCALIDAQLEVFPTHESSSGPDWASLLKVCAARSTFRRLHSIVYRANEVIEFLVADTQLPNSISHSLQEMAHAHAAIATRWNSKAERSVDRRVGRARALIEYDWPVRNQGDDSAIRSILGDVSASCIQFSNDIENAYFTYPLTDEAVP